MAGKSTKRLIKGLVAVGVLAVLAVLVLRSVRDTRATPYTVERGALQGATLALYAASSPGEPMLALKPSGELANRLFDQVFRRTMESMRPPGAPSIPLVLQGEFDRAFAGRVVPDALVAAARSAGLDSIALQPRCLGYRRVSLPRANKQVFFVLFDMPAFARFRQQIATMAGPGFDPAALSPVLMVAVAESDFLDWMPLRADPNTDCVAPIATAKE